MATRFNSISGAAATRKRKRRFPEAREKAATKKRSLPGSVKCFTSMVTSLNGQLCRSLFGTGVNSGSTVSGVQEVVRLLDAGKKITRDAVFVDFGCSVGGVCMYIAARFGCKTIGIEKDANTVRIGQKFLAGLDGSLSRLCSFIIGDFTKVVDEAFLWRQGVTHVFAYDAVFSPDSWHVLFHQLLASGPPIVGVSCARKRECKLPEEFTILQKSAKPIGLTGSPSKFKVVSWKNF